MEEGRLFHDKEIKNKLAESQPFGDWVSKITDLDKVLSKVTEKAVFSGNQLRKRQIAAGYSIEEIEQILAPMVEDAKETLASMGMTHQVRFYQKSTGHSVTTSGKIFHKLLTHQLTVSRISRDVTKDTFW